VGESTRALHLRCGYHLFVASRFPSLAKQRVEANLSVRQSSIDRVSGDEQRLGSPIMLSKVKLGAGI
jgi:hypothetical protein